MSIDTIGNFLTSIRNSIARVSRFVKVPYSKLKHNIALTLLKEGFIKDVSIEGEGVEKKLVIGLKYVNNESVIHEIVQISTPGRRVYIKSTCIPTVIGGLGIAIMTTNKGIMTNKQVRELKIGGEIICTVW
jgi:small subunit ribosomal protein S8